MPDLRLSAVCIAIHRKLHTVLRCLAVQMRTVFGSAPCLKLSVYRYKSLIMASARQCSAQFVADVFPGAVVKGAVVEI